MWSPWHFSLMPIWTRPVSDCSSDFFSGSRMQLSRHSGIIWNIEGRSYPTKPSQTSLGLRRRGVSNCFSVPPSLASLLLLSRAINASRPSLTKEVFSLIPVSLDAFSINSSSMIKVVLMARSLQYMSKTYALICPYQIHSASGFSGMTA